MNIGLLREVTKKGITTVHAAVTGANVGKKGGKAELWVIFSVDGKPENPIITEKGLASLSLAKLKPGRHIVKAEIVDDGTADEAEVLIKPKVVGWFGATMMVAYWITFGFWFGYPAYVVTALAVTVGVLALIAALDGEGFLESLLMQLGNNNWVLRTASWMLFGVILIWFLDPTAPAVRETIGQLWQIVKNPLTAWGQVKGLLSGQLEDPLHRGWYWTSLSHFFFGPADGVGPMVLWVQFWGWFFAIFVSKLDEVAETVKGVGGGRKSGEGFGKFLLKDGFAEIFWRILTIPFRWLF